MSVLAECLHPPLEAYGRRAKAIVDQTRDIDGIPSTVLEDVLNGTRKAIMLSKSLHVLLHNSGLLNCTVHSCRMICEFVRNTT